MTGIELYSTTASNNNSAPPNGWPEGQAPSTVNDCARQMMAAIRTWYEIAEWINLGYTHTYGSGTTFTIASTDVTTIYSVGRRVKAVGSSTGTIYGIISATAFATNTTVTIVWDSGSLSNEALTVSIGIHNPLTFGLPPYTDTYPVICGSADKTKKLRLEVDGFTTATTRVLTPPNFDGTIATLAGTETFTNKTITNPNIIGTTTDDDAAAGSVGEVISSAIAIGSAVSLTTNTAANITSISLTAGDWDVDGNVALNINAATVVTYLYGSVNTTSATLGTADLGGISAYVLSTGSTGLNPVIATGTRRLKLIGTTTVYLVCTCGFTVNSAAAYGLIRARRVR